MEIPVKASYKRPLPSCMASLSLFDWRVQKHYNHDWTISWRVLTFSSPLDQADPEQALRFKESRNYNIRFSTLKNGFALGMRGENALSDLRF